MPSTVETEIAVMLTQANLLRLRREFERATAQCVEVLRRYPNNASAHSLLGDILRDQGAYGEALGWYKLALQLDPESAADRTKVGEIAKRLASPRGANESRTSIGRRLSSLARARLPLGLVLGLAVGCLVLASLVALSMRGEKSRVAILDEVGLPRVLSQAGPDLNRAPAPRPALPAAPTKAPPAVIEQPVYVPGCEPARLAPTQESSPTDREERLLQCLRASAAAEELMVAIDAVAIDPREQAATLDMTTREVLAEPRNRQLVLQRCLRAGELALQHDKALTRVTVRCKSPVAEADGLQREQLVFIGDLSASALKSAQGRPLNFDEALKLFAPAPWWHPRMQTAN